MNAKKLIGVVLTAALSMALLAGCGGNNSNTPTGGTAGGETATTAPAASGSESTESTLDYPKQTIQLVVPYSAGGAMDLTARVFTQYAEKYCGQSIVINNVAGGSGSVGAQQVLSSKADGYTVLIHDPGPGFITTSSNTVPFNFDTDFVVAGRQTFDARVIAVKADDPRFSSPADFIQYVKDHPGELNVGSPGASTDGQVSVVLLQQAGLDMAVIGCNGASEVKSQLMGGHIDAGALSVSDVIPMLSDNQVMVIGICSEERSEMLPDAQTFKELGYDVEWGTSRGYTFKAGTDEQIIQYWSDLIKQVSEDPEYQEALHNLGCPVAYENHEQYAQTVSDTFATLHEILG